MEQMYTAIYFVTSPAGYCMMDSGDGTGLKCEKSAINSSRLMRVQGVGLALLRKSYV